MKAIDYAKYFISQKIGAEQNSLEGNMKLQKLLFFADMISLAKYDKPLFDDEIYAFKMGCVIENVRRTFKFYYDELTADSFNRLPEYNETDKKILEITRDIYGDASAEELSELNHQYNFWKKQYKAYCDTLPNAGSDISIVTVDMMRSEIDAMKQVLYAYSQRNHEDKCITINGVNFYCDKDIEITEKIRKELMEYSIDADDDSYCFYYDEDYLVVY